MAQAGCSGALKLLPSKGFIVVKPLRVDIQAIRGVYVKDKTPELEIGEVVAIPTECVKTDKDKKNQHECPSFSMGSHIVYKKLLGKVGEMCVVETKDVVGVLRTE